MKRTPAGQTFWQDVFLFHSYRRAHVLPAEQPRALLWQIFFLFSPQKKLRQLFLSLHSILFVYWEIYVLFCAAVMLCDPPLFSHRGISAIAPATPTDGWQNVNASCAFCNDRYIFRVLKLYDKRDK
jgi:hypothetical protein